MSSPEQAVIARSVQANRYIDMVAFTILYYDYMLTATTEIDRFWKTFKLTWVSFLYVSNRILSLLGHIPVIIIYFSPLSENRCREMETYHQYLEMLTQGIVAVLLIIRTYALCNRSLSVLIVFLTMMGAGAGVGIWAILTSPETNILSVSQYSGCDLSSSVNQGIRLACIWGVMLLIDTTVFTITFFKGVQTSRSLRGGTLRVMLRDGILYFGVLVVINVVNILSFIVFPPLDRGMTTTLTNVLSSTLISRLMLNLRDPRLTLLPGANAVSFSIENASLGAYMAHSGPLFFAEQSNAVPDHIDDNDNQHISAHEQGFPST